MKIINIAQNTDEWLSYRLGKSGGSEFKNLYPAKAPLKGSLVDYLTQKGIEFKKTATAESLAQLVSPQDMAEIKLQGAPKDRFYELIAERVAKPLNPDDYSARLNGRPFTMMLRGHLLEDDARKAVSERLGKEFVGEKAIWESDNNPNCFVSPDGWVEANPITEALEIKCLESSKIVKSYITDEYPQEYFPQVCKYFMVNENLETLYFALYTDLIPELKLQVWTVKRADVSNYIAEMQAYENGIMQKVDYYVKQILAKGF